MTGYMSSLMHSPQEYSKNQAAEAAKHSYDGVQNQQLLPTPQMSLGGNRNSKSVEIGLDGYRHWNNDICRCHERPWLACAAYCCPCVIWSLIHSKTEHLVAHGTPHPNPRKVGSWCCIIAFSPICVDLPEVLLDYASRAATRKRYGIRGNWAEDFAIALCLPCCSIVQEYREIEDEEIALGVEPAPRPTRLRPHNLD